MELTLQTQLGSEALGVWPQPNQVGVSAGGNSCILWLRADKGVALSSASANALSAWTLTRLTPTAGQADPDSGTGGILYTDTADGAPTTHTAVAVLSNCVDGPRIFVIWAKAGTLDQIQIQVGAAGTLATFFTFSTGLFSGTTASVTPTVMATSGAWFKLRIEVSGTVASTPNCIVYASVGGSATYQGAGTGTFSLYQPVYTQDRVSQWDDQSGFANHVTQATAGSQMLRQCFDTAGLWVPMAADCRIGWPVDAEKSLNLPAGVYDAFDGDSAPMTVLAVVQRTGALAADSFGIVRLTGTTARRDIGQVDSATNAYQEVHTDDAAATKTWLSTRPAALTWHSLVSVNATAEKLYTDGTIDTASPRDVDVGVQSMTGGIIGARMRLIREIAVFRSSLSDTDRWRVENGMRQRWGLPVLPQPATYPALSPLEVDPANLLLWLRADTGVTLSSASISNDTLATWTLTASGTRAVDTDPVGGAGAVKYTDAVDGAPTNHGFSRVPANVVAGPAFVDFWLKPGNLLVWARVTMANSGHWVYINLTTGAVGTNSGGADLMSIVLLDTVGSWRKFRVYTQSASGNETCIVWFAKTDGGASYQGDGTGTAFIGTGVTYGPLYTQDRVSVWADQSGNGNNATQVTAASQMFLKCYDVAGNWVPYGQGYNCEIGWPVDAVAKSCLFGAPVVAYFTGNGKPYTCMDLRNHLVASPVTVTPGGDLYLNTPGAGVQVMTNSANKLTHTHTDDGSVAKTQTTTSTFGTGYKTFAATYDGTNGNVYMNNVGDATNPTNLDVGQETPTIAGFHSLASMRRELVIYKSVLTDTQRRSVENGMRVRAGMAPL